MGELIYCNLEQLELHPENIRVYYQPEQVTEMAGSIQACGGVLQALLVVPGQKPGKYMVVDGNLRLMAGRELGAACPPLKCEIISADHAQQLLVMAATGLHYPKDPVSEARHYRRLIDQEGYSVAEICARTGLSRNTVDSRLLLLELDEDIQQLIAAGKLNKDSRVARALRSIPDAPTRVRLARRFAGHGTGTEQIVKQCRSVLERGWRLAGKPLEERQRPQMTLVVKKEPPEPDGRLSAEAAEVIWAVAEKTQCEECRLGGLGEQCYLCPGPQEFINHIVELAESRRAEIERQGGPLHAAA